MIRERTDSAARLSLSEWRMDGGDVQAWVNGSVCIRRDVRCGRETLILDKKSHEDIFVSARFSEVRGC
jgi:hypothetical protein